MKNGFKRFLSLMLVMMMVIGSTGLPALAEGDIPEANEITQEQTNPPAAPENDDAKDGGRDSTPPADTQDGGNASANTAGEGITPPSGGNSSANSAGEETTPPSGGNSSADDQQGDGNKNNEGNDVDQPSGNDENDADQPGDDGNGSDENDADQPGDGNGSDENDADQPGDGKDNDENAAGEPQPFSYETQVGSVTVTVTGEAGIFGVGDEGGLSVSAAGNDDFVEAAEKALEAQSDEYTVIRHRLYAFSAGEQNGTARVCLTGLDFTDLREAYPGGELSVYLLRWNGGEKKADRVSAVVEKDRDRLTFTLSSLGVYDLVTVIRLPQPAENNGTDGGEIDQPGDNDGNENDADQPADGNENINNENNDQPADDNGNDGNDQGDNDQPADNAGEDTILPPTADNNDTDGGEIDQPADNADNDGNDNENDADQPADGSENTNNENNDQPADNNGSDGDEQDGSGQPGAPTTDGENAEEQQASLMRGMLLGAAPTRGSGENTAHNVIITIVPGADVIPLDSVTADPVSAAQDETVTLTVAGVEDGYELVSLTVTYTDENGEEKTITPVQDANDPNQYTFTMPDADAHVEAAFTMSAVTFDPGKGNADNTMEPVYVPMGAEYELPECGYNVTGMEFTGWLVGGSTEPEPAGTMITVDDDVTLTAAYRVPYLDENGVTQYCTDFDVFSTEASAGWYVATHDMNISDRIALTGTAHLILLDGVTLEVSKGIYVASGGSLTIYGQNAGTGKLVIDDVPSGYAGIACTGATVTINGGTVNVKGFKSGAGIGGNNNASCGTVIINGGTVTANGGRDGAGIGGGDHGAGGRVTINGGTVTATGRGYGAGIGGGDHGAGGTVTINGGAVKATGGGGSEGAGIGGGYEGVGGTVNISGGTVKASSIGYGKIDSGLSSGPLTVGFTSSAASLYAISYDCKVTVKTGMYLKDSASGQCYDGTLTDSQKEAIQKKTLVKAGQPHTITVNSAENGTVSSITRTDENTRVTLSVSPNPGYALETLTVTYTDGDGQHTLETVPGAEAGTYTFTMPNADVTVNAAFSHLSYTVRFDPNAENVSGAMADQSFTYGTAQALTENAYTRRGYDFAGWNTLAAPTQENPGTPYEDGETVNNLTTAADTTITLYAQWTIRELTLTLPEVTGCSVTAKKTKNIHYGDPVTLNVRLNSGYQLISVCYNDGEDHEITPENGVYSFSMPDADVTVTVTLLRDVTYGMHVFLDGRNADYVPGFAYDGEAVKPEVTVEDYLNHDQELIEGTDFTVTFDQNTLAEGETTALATVTITGMGDYKGEKTVHFRIGSMNIADCTFEGTPCVYLGEQNSCYPANDFKVYYQSTLLECDKDYSIFFDDYDDEKVIGQNYGVTLEGIDPFTGSLSITVTVDYPHIPVVFDANGGTGEMAGSTVTVGEYYELPECGFDPPEGMEFFHWQPNTSDPAPGPHDFIQVPFGEQLVVTAIWSPIDYDITVPETVKNGSIAVQKIGADVTYAHIGETVTLIPAPAPGFALVENSLTVTYTDENGEKVPVEITQGTGDKANQFTFTMPAHDVTVSAAFGISYLDEFGAEQLCTDCTVLESMAATLSGWVVVAEDVDMGETRLTVSDYAHLILRDGATLTAKKGIQVTGILTIYGQSAGTGALTIDGDSVDYGNAGIGGNSKESCGGVTINGGTVTAKGGQYSAGIGGGYQGNGGNVTVNGGAVNATGGDFSAGIGGGYRGNGGNVTVNRGNITANGGGYGAGIGSGASAIRGGDVTINGGTVTATGSKDGAGIGSGGDGAGCTGGTVTITGGKVTANGGENAVGIGCGPYCDDPGTLTVGFANDSDSLTATGYGCTVKAAKNKYIKDSESGQCYHGTLTDDEKAALADRTLVKAGQAYSVTLETEGYCEAIPSVTLAEPGTEITLTLTPNAEMYSKLDKDSLFVIYENEDGEEAFDVELTPGTGDDADKYTFTMPRGSVTIYATFGVPYMDEDGDTLYCTEYTLLDDKATTLSGWVVVAEEVDMDETRLEASGEAHLILCDGVTLSAPKGIHVGENSSLTIYSQSMDEETMGALAIDNVVYCNAGIGGNNEEQSCGTVTVNGGKVTANGGSFGAGIGGGYQGAGGTITVNGGTVNATGGNSGAGIGGGLFGAGGTITVNGGKVEAAGKNDGAGIGGGYRGDGGKVTVTGGTVTATGGGENAVGVGPGADYEGDEPGTLTVGFANNADSLTASSYGGTVKVAEGKILMVTDTDGEHYYAGVLTGEEKEALKNKTLRMNIDGAVHIIHTSITGPGTVIAPGAAETNDAVTLIVEPVTGCALAENSLTASYTDGDGQTQPITLTQGTGDKANEYTFTMPAGNVTVRAAFLSPWGELQNLLNADGTVTLDKDYTAMAADSALTVPSGVTVTLDLNGHTIDRNLSEAVSGGNVINVYGNLTVKDSKSDGKITGGNNTDNYGGGGVFVVGGTFTLNGGGITGNKTSRGGGVLVDDKGTFTMNGGSITGNTSPRGGGVYVYESTFTMDGGSITGNTAGSYGGGVYVNGSTFTMTGGSITGNTAGYAGGVYVSYTSAAKGTFTMDGGDVTGNTSTRGGGVYVNGSTFTMNDGSITGNTTNSYGGGVYVNDSTFTMNDGSITGNTTGGYGGGVYMPTNSTFTMNGGSITGNTANTKGGGVYVKSTFNVSGAPVISGNTRKGSAENVLLTGSSNITIPEGETLSSAASIGVTTGSARVFTSGLSGKGTAENFFSDSNAYAVGVNADGEAFLGTPVTVTFNAGDGSGSMDPVTVAADSVYTLPASTFTAPAGMVFKEWSAEIGTAAAVAKAAGETITVTADATVTAVWEESIALLKVITVSFKDKLQINYYIQLPDDVLSDAGAYLLATKNGASQKLPVKKAELCTDSDLPAQYGCHRFSYSIVAKEARDNIHVALYYGDGTPVKTTTADGTVDLTETGYDFTAMTYLNYMAEHGSDKMKALALATKDYCTAAQLHFNYNTDSIGADDGVRALVDEVSPDELESTYAASSTGVMPGGIDLDSMTVLFQSDHSFRLYFQYDDVKTRNDYSYKVDGGTAKLKKRTTDSKYYIEKTGVPARLLHKPHTYTITKGDDTYTVTASMITYAVTAMEYGTDTMKTLAKAFYLYNRAALAYFGEGT